MSLVRSLRPRHLCLTALVCSAFLLGGCNKAPTTVKAPKTLTVSVVPIKSSKEIMWTETLGEVQGKEQTEVRAQVSGILKEIAYTEGKPVREGDVLFVLDDAPYRAALHAASAGTQQIEAQLQQNEREAARYQKLFDARAVSQKQLDDALSAVRISRALLASTKAKEDDARIELERTRITAPSDGIAGRAVVNKGTLVNANSTLLALLTQTDRLRVTFSLSERDIGGNVITLDNQIRLRDANGTIIPAKLDYVSRQLDAKSASLTLRAVVPDNALSLLPGQLVSVQVQLTTLPNVYRVPQRAVLQRPDGSYQVYVVRDGKARPQDVTVGNWKDSDWIILSGLKEGDQVITDQLLRLKPGLPVKTQNATPAK